MEPINGKFEIKKFDGSGDLVCGSLTCSCNLNCRDWDISKQLLLKKKLMWIPVLKKRERRILWLRRRHES